jgi:UDP-glucose 4-epimerase
MNILLTGGSSFTGMWFATELAQAGHTITATLLQSKDRYKGIRAERVEKLAQQAKIVENCPFGSDAFFELLNSQEHWDVLCHHAADVTDYKSPSFNTLRAVDNNTHNLPSIIEILKKKGCNKIVLTGSVFEQREGTGSDNLRAVSPYGLSKGLTSDVFAYWCSIHQMKLGKFVIPNPFGPYEEERFTTFLMKKWFKGEVPDVSHPEYIRDNIHVTLLAKAYAMFVDNLTVEPGFEQLNPSGYVGLQGDFATMFATEMDQRMPFPCSINILKQKEFSEPIERVNTDPLDSSVLNWDEAQAWDDIASYYNRSTF